MHFSKDHMPKSSFIEGLFSYVHVILILHKYGSNDHVHLEPDFKGGNDMGHLMMIGRGG